MLTLSYSFTADPITQYYKIDEGTNRMITSYMNASDNKYFGISLSLPFQATKWWNMQNSLNGYWQTVNTFYKEEVKKQYTSIYINTTQNFILPKNYSIELAGWYSSGGGWGLSEWKPIGGLDIGIQKKFPQKKSDLRLSFRNILNTQDYGNTTSVPEQNLCLKSSANWSNPNFSITFMHSFGNDKVKAKRDRSTGAEEEQGRAN